MKTLFAVSGNRCAFPECDRPLVVMSGDVPVVMGRICHIKGRKRGSKRYDAHQPERDRHTFQNLILLCGDHHTLIDADDSRYTVEILTQMKEEHERAFSKSIEVPKLVPRLLIEASLAGNIVISSEIWKYNDEIGFPPAVVLDAIRRADKVQTVGQAVLYLKSMRYRDRKCFCLILCHRPARGDMTAMFAFRLWPSIARADVEPLELLREVAARFGLPLAIALNQQPSDLGDETCIIDRPMPHIDLYPTVWFKRRPGEQRRDDLLQIMITKADMTIPRCWIAVNIDLRRYFGWLRSA